MRQIFKLIAFLLFSLFIIQKVIGQQNQYQFEVKKTGNGRSAIIFIPGFACSCQVWDATRAQYEEQYTCYSLTMAGFAGVPASCNPAFTDREKAIADFIKEKKIQKPIIIGHSMGGAWAMAIAADYPELVSKVVVVDALPCLPALYNPNFKVKENNDCGSMTKNISAMDDDAFYKIQTKSMAQLVADTTKIEMLARWSLTSDRTTFTSLFCDFMNTDLRDKIANVKCPVLILLEPKFESIKTAINEQYVNLKGADIRYATKGLHFIMYDDKEWFDTQLKSFIP